MKIFGKTLKEYVWPIKWYILFSVLVVISQYYVAHGLKASVFRVFLFPYSSTLAEVFEKIIGKFLYGSLLVMAIAIILGLIFIKLKNNQEVRESFRWL